MAGNRLYINGPVGIVVQHTPDLVDALIHPVFKVDVGVVTPKLFLDFLAGYDLAGLAGEQGKKAKRLRRQFDESAVFAQLLGSEICLESSKAKKLLRGAQERLPCQFAPDYITLLP